MALRCAGQVGAGERRGRPARGAFAHHRGGAVVGDRAARRHHGVKVALGLTIRIFPICGLEIHLRTRPGRGEEDPVKKEWPSCCSAPWRWPSSMLYTFSTYHWCLLCWMDRGFMLDFDWGKADSSD